MRPLFVVVNSDKAHAPAAGEHQRRLQAPRTLPPVAQSTDHTFAAATVVAFRGRLYVFGPSDIYISLIGAQ